MEATNNYSTHKRYSTGNYINEYCQKNMDCLEKLKCQALCERAAPAGIYYARV